MQDQRGKVQYMGITPLQTTNKVMSDTVKSYPFRTELLLYLGSKYCR